MKEIHVYRVITSEVCTSSIVDEDEEIKSDMQNRSCDLMLLKLSQCMMLFRCLQHMSKIY